MMAQFLKRKKDDSLSTISNSSGGYVLQLQNFSVNDGEGIRTIVFLAGCPLHCAWCANPEGITMNNDMTHYMTVDEVLKKVKKQLLFYRHSGGGVTFSGGEATVQTDFLRSMVNRMYDMGINLAIETCGHFNFDSVYDILQKMDLIFMDIKHMNPEKHSYWTKGDLSLILENIKKVSTLGVPMVLRIPTIVGVNADEENMRATFQFIQENVPQAKLEFLPYHRFGESKYTQLGLPLPDESFQTPSEDLIQKMKDLAHEYHIDVVSYR